MLASHRRNRCTAIINIQQRVQERIGGNCLCEHFCIIGLMCFLFSVNRGKHFLGLSHPWHLRRERKDKK